MIFERTQWCEDGKAIYAEIDEKPYILTLDGSIYDPAHSHLPLRKKSIGLIFLKSSPIGHYQVFSSTTEILMLV